MNINACIPWNENLDEFEENIRMAHKCGYQCVFIEFISKGGFKQFKDSKFFPKKLPTISFPVTVASLSLLKTDATPIPLIPRFTLRINSPQKLKQELSQISQTPWIIAVESSHKETLEVAARDSRVKILSVPSPENFKALTKGILSLAKQTSCALDISITSFIKAERSKRNQIMRLIYRLFLRAKPSPNTYIIGTHSKNVWNIRGPTETLAILHALFKVSNFHAKQMLQANAEGLALEYLKRLYHLVMEEGVEIVDKKEVAK